MRLPRLVLFIFFLLKINIAFCQGNRNDFLFYRINERNGLSNNLVNAIIKDKEGFLWIATFDGLNRFDGTHFTVFRNNRNQRSSLVNNSVHGLCVDKNDNIWCAAQTGISRFNKRTQRFENYFPATQKNGVNYTDIVCDKWGTIWCSSNFGIHEYQPGTNSFRNYTSDGPPGQSLTADVNAKRSLALSPDGESIWIATVKGINQLDITTKKIYNYKNNPKGLKVFDSLTQYPLCFDRKGDLIYGFAQTGQIVQYDFKTDSVRLHDILFSNNTKNKTSVAYIYPDRHNRLWLSTWGNACFVYDTRSQQVSEFSYNSENPFSVPGDFFWSCFEDEEGTLWMSTVNGLAYTNAESDNFRLHRPLGYSAQHGLLNGIRCFIEGDNGQWWFTCHNKSEVYQYDPLSGNTKPYKIPIDDFRNRSISWYKNYLLLSTNSGIYTFNTSTGLIENCAAIEPLQKIAGNQNVNWLQFIGDSVICMLAQSTGLVQYNLNTKTFKIISTEQNIFLKRNISRSPACILSADGNLYISFNSLKIARYNLKANRLDSISVPFDNKIKITDGLSMTFKEDKNGNLWLAINETGLLFYNIKTGETKLWQQSEGLVINQVYESAIDNSGKIWSAAYNKFSVFDPVNNSFDNFSLPVSENNYAYSSKLLNLHNENILSNIEKYFIEWFPEKIKNSTISIPVLINRIVVNDSILWPDSSIRLKHTDNNFTIEFGVLTGMEKTRYHLQYKLEGFDPKWKDADMQNRAVYTNVPETDFVFKVRAVSANGNWQGKETTLAIQVIPPFYRTTWFRIVAALLFAAVIVWLIRLRINNIRKSEKQKSEFNQMLNEWQLKALRSQMNPHFIFNCMNSIDMYILKNDAENASRYLNKFAKLVRLILNQSNDMYVPLGKEIEMLKYYLELEALRFDYPFSYSINCSDDLDLEETEIPSMLLQPYVENAILHGLRHKKEKGNLSIQVLRNDNNLFCAIEDDGIGRERSAEINATRTGKHESRGTILAEERLKVMEKDKSKPVINIIDLKNETGTASGTRVEITIPMDFDY